MAHIRQILANLSISISEFKKSPKSVIKAVRTEPIAVIDNNKPAFYCVPADILETLYQKFYELNEIQNIQDLNTSVDHDAVTHDSDEDDDSFGVNDIFQSIEDEQAAKVHQPEDLVDPINNHVADPLDEEVANQLNSSIDKHLLDHANQMPSCSCQNGPHGKCADDDNGDDAAMENLNHIGEVDDFGALDSLSALRGFNSVDPLNGSAMGEELSYPLSNGDFEPSSSDLGSGGDISADELDPTLDSPEDNAGLSGRGEQLSVQSGALGSDFAAQDPITSTCDPDKCLEDRAALREAMRDVNQELHDRRNLRSIVSGPHSFSLEHVAKTYSPYQQKKIQSKLKKERKAKSKDEKSDASTHATCSKQHKAELEAKVAKLTPRGFPTPLVASDKESKKAIKASKKAK